MARKTALSVLAQISSYAPDSFDDVSGAWPEDDFVVSRHRDGSVASRFGDLKWDRTAYDPDGRQRWLYFPFYDEVSPSERQMKLNGESRWLLFLMLTRHFHNEASYSTLDNLVGTLRTLAAFCEERSLGFSELLADENCLVQLLDGGLTGSNIINLRQLINVLLKLGEKQTGYRVPGNNLINLLKSRIESFKETSKQHPPIPTRIYSFILAALSNELDGFERVAPRYLSLLRVCVANPLMGKSKSGQWATKKRMGLDSNEELPSFPALLERYELTSYFNERGLGLDRKGLVSGLVDIQMAAKLLIQAYSGMRSEEAQYLPYNCLESVVSSGIQHFVVHGRTTKLSHGRAKRVRWVTSREGHKAIRVAQLIADVIYEMNEVDLKGIASYGDGFPLFLSMRYLPSAQGRPVAAADSIYMPTVLNFPKFVSLRDRLATAITEDDLRELEQIDPHRAWSFEDNFRVGHPWVLTSHQLRRSLALYAQRSGLVSLPSLRRQLQHVTEEMSRYYARGSAFAKDFIGKDKKHFGHDWQDAQPVSAALSYMMNVLLSDEVLFGGHANWVDHRQRGLDGVVIVDREVTLQRFKKGELAYRETFLGGCTNPDGCEQVAIKWLDVDCLAGCRNLVGRLPKLERVISAQAQLVERLEPASAEYRAEKADLVVLVETRERVLHKLAAGGDAK